MKTIFVAPVNGIELRFTNGGINLDPAHNLDDPAIRAIYSFGQRLHPIIVHLKRVRGCPYPETIEEYALRFPNRYGSPCPQVRIGGFLGDPQYIWEWLVEQVKFRELDMLARVLA